MRDWYADDIYVCGEDAGGRPGGEVVAKCEPTVSGLFDRAKGREIAKKIVDAVNSQASLLAQKAALEAMVTSAAQGKCMCCDWPLSESAERGCVQGNCSFRPSEQYPMYRQWKERMEIVAALFLALTPRTP